MKRKLVGLLAVCGAVACMNPLSANAAGVTADAFTGSTLSSGTTPIDWVNNTGAYAFTGSCLAGATVDSSGPSVSTGCNVNANGTYINVVCGTGATGVGLTDTANVSSTTAVVGHTSTATTKYSIVFVATIGVLAGEVTNIDGAPATGAEAGVVQINAIPTPPNPGDTNHLGVCTTGFSVEVVAAGAGA